MEPSLQELNQLMEALGYRFEQDTDGTVRMYRPDGSLAMTATPPVEAQPK